MQREKTPEWREKQKSSRGIRRGQRYRLVFQFPIRVPFWRQQVYWPAPENHITAPNQKAPYWSTSVPSAWHR
ncbi:IS91 ORF (plasmid) [Shigella boydii CDC 3083-94]|uniref:IS91 ORF n=1 Tax=Shigella boydii serotype 18 (strain CDC 3083-94 / BS512) TaxID=344609 RepID=B2TST0_SHIB3|nr:IS91 ORF [Shigella boydii CDC 3083-94]